MSLETFEIQMREEANTMCQLEEQVVDLMRTMQEDLDSDSIDPQMRKEVRRMLAHLTEFRCQIQASLASSDEMVDMLEPTQTP